MENSSRDNKQTKKKMENIKLKETQKKNGERKEKEDYYG